MKIHLLFLAILPASLLAANFRAEKVTEQGIEVVRLTDSSRQVEVSIVPSIGNRAVELKVHGQNLLYFPMNLASFKGQGSHSFNGIPFLAPWGNRIPGGGFSANGKRYDFNAKLGNLSVNQDGIAIHGMLAASPLWQIADLGADLHSAHVTSKLEFWRYPDLMANWPFAQEYEITYTLNSSGLEVTTAIHNLSAEPMPVVIGFHPYFNIPSVPRSEWFAHIPARKHVETDSSLVATGEMTPSGLPDQVSLRDRTFDDGYTDLIRDTSGRATFTIKAGSKAIDVVYGPEYRVAIVFAPPNKDFLCFEPMAAITNGINLAHEGEYPDLQMLAPNATWRESFWIRFSGF